MTTTALLTQVKARTELAANWRSDDFGHDCQELLLAESRALQVAADDIARLIAIVEIYEGALRMIGAEGFPAVRRQLIAEAALQAADKLASDE